MSASETIPDGWIGYHPAGFVPYGGQLIDVQNREGTRAFNQVAGEVKWTNVTAYRLVVKPQAPTGEGWITTGSTTRYRWEKTDIIDIEYDDGFREFSRVAGDVHWQKVRAFRVVVKPQAALADDEAERADGSRCDTGGLSVSLDDAPVTLNAARNSLLLSIAALNQQMSAGVVDHLDIVKDYLDQQVPREILSNENADKLRAENNEFRWMIEQTGRAHIANWSAYAHMVEQVAMLTTITSNINIAIARGHLAHDFDKQLAEWSK